MPGMHPIPPAPTTTSMSPTHTDRLKAKKGFGHKLTELVWSFFSPQICSRPIVYAESILESYYNTEQAGDQRSLRKEVWVEECERESGEAGKGSRELAQVRNSTRKSG